MTSSDASRRYQVWTAQDYRIVVTAIQENMSEEQIALGVGRSFSAVRSRARYLIDEVPGDDRPAWSRLCEELRTNPGYDWESVARRAHAAEQLPYWDEAAEDRLDQVWIGSVASADRPDRQPRTLMAELVRELGIEEFEIAKRLRYLGWAASFPEIVDRLGAAPHGLLAARARLISDRASVTLHTLVITDDSGAVLHTSLHADQAAAEHTRDDYRAGAPPLATWTIAARSPGDGEIGRAQDLTGSFGTSNTPTVVTPDLEPVDPPDTIAEPAQHEPVETPESSNPFAKPLAPPPEYYGPLGRRSTSRRRGGVDPEQILRRGHASVPPPPPASTPTIRYELSVNVPTDGEDFDDVTFTVTGLTTPRVGEEVTFESDPDLLVVQVTHLDHLFFAAEHAPPRRVLSVTARSLPYSDDFVRRLRDPAVLDRWLSRFPTLERS